MDSTELTVSYIDEKDSWGNVKPMIQNLFALKEIEFNLENTKYLVKNLKIGFYPHDDEILKKSESPVYYYRKPLIHILLVTCNQKENYEEEVKSKCQRFIDTFDNKEEWLIIYTVDNPIIADEEYVIFVSFLMNVRKINKEYLSF